MQSAYLLTVVSIIIPIVFHCFISTLFLPPAILLEYKNFFFNSVEYLQPLQNFHNECHEAISCCNCGGSLFRIGIDVNWLTFKRKIICNQFSFILNTRLIFFNLYFTSLSFHYFRDPFYGHFRTFFISLLFH